MPDGNGRLAEDPGQPSLAGREVGHLLDLHRQVALGQR